jgi:hypothetical protein
MIERLAISAPGRAGFAEVMDPRLTHVRVASRSVLLEALRRNQRADARLNCRARDRADERTHDERASVSHPHGEASGPGAWSFRTDAKKTQFGGTRSHSSDVLVFAFVCAGDDRGEVTYVNESVNEDASYTMQRVERTELC